MTERTGELTFKGSPLTLLGPRLNAGDKAPDFTLLATDLSKVTLGDSAGKVRVLSVAPSLDTPVCDVQTRKFNEELGKLGDGVVGYCITADLPFAQNRFCSTAGIENVKPLSDHFDLNFADAYGVHIKELRLDSRSVFVIDGDGMIQYCEYVPEVAQEPDYDAALAAVKKLVG